MRIAKKYKFMDRGFIKRLEKTYGSLSLDKQQILNDINDETYMTVNCATFSYRLASATDNLDELRRNIEMWMINSKPFPDNSLDSCKFQFGVVLGTIEYNRRRELNSNRTRNNGSSWRCKDQEELQRLAVEGQEKSRERDPLYDKKRNAFCKEFYTSKGITDTFEIERLMNISKRKCGLKKEEFILKHGQERWDDKFLAIKRGFLTGRSSCKISKESISFFRKVLDEMNEIVELDNIWWFDHPRGEWWITHDGFRYFIDLCFVEYKIAVEYHGRKFHPVSLNDEIYESGRFGNMLSSEDKFVYDSTKKNAIIEKGYTYIEVWSHNLPSPKQIAEKIDAAIRTYRRTTILPTP